LTSPGETPEQDLPRSAQQPAASGARELSPEQLRAKVAALAEQVRQLGNGSHSAVAVAPAVAVADNGDARVSEPAADGAAHVSEPAAGGDAPASEPAADGAEEFARHSGRLLDAVIETAELAAAEIRAGAEREAAEIRERADAAIGEADAALARYREALAALSKETERIERAVDALREQARTLEAERAQIDTALDLLRRRRPAR
jgi:polyhydroxyalkanoate synthesis regulator phasin